MALMSSYVLWCHLKFFLCSKQQPQVGEDLRVYLYHLLLCIRKARIFYCKYSEISTATYRPSPLTHSFYFLSNSLLAGHSLNFFPLPQAQRGKLIVPADSQYRRFKYLNLLKVKWLKTKMSRQISISTVNILLFTVTFTSLHHSIGNFVFWHSMSCICIWMRYTPKAFHYCVYRHFIGFFFPHKAYHLTNKNNWKAQRDGKSPSKS